MNRTHAYWLCQIAGWGLLYGVNIAAYPENWTPGEISTSLLNWSVGVGLATGVTHAFRLYAKQHGWTKMSLVRVLPRALVASVALAVLYVIVERIIYYPLGLVRSVANRRAAPPSLLQTAVNVIPIMSAWVALYLGVHAFWNYRRAEVDRWRLQAQAETARLEALKFQLNPHFFFNSLASVRSLISEAPRRAKKMVARLARLLRTTLQARDQKTKPLDEELSMVRTYLRLEKVRFEDRLDWTIDAGETALQRQVPFMLVQTLTENAVKHGIGRHQGAGRITISADLCPGADSEHGDLLRVRVSNPGQLNESGDAHGSGTGLDNAQERLRLLFGEAADLQLIQSGPETVTAVAKIPQQLSARRDAGHNETGAEHWDPVAGDGPAGGSPPKQDHSGGASGDPSETSTQPGPPLPESSQDRSREDSNDMLALLAGHSTYWFCQVIGWGLLGIGNAVVTLEKKGNWADIGGDAVLGLIGFVGLGVALTHVFRGFAKHRGWTERSPGPLVPRIVVSASLLGSSFTLLMAPTYVPPDLPSGIGLRVQRVVESLIPPALGWTGAMGAWLAIYFSVHAFWTRRQAEVDRWKLQARAETARLEALKLQLNPHFFFNSLASVRSLISEAPRRAKKMVSQLARLLRKTLQAGDQKTVPLEEDLSMAETYLKLEKVRFEDRLDWELSVTEASLEHQVPFMLVQTLVENAVRHGIGQRRTGGTISIEAALTGNAGEEDSSLCLRVSNPGELDEKSGAEQDSGAGLENARERLQLLFGDEATLELTQEPGTVTATARIPQPSALEDQLVGSDFGPETVRRTDEAGLIEAGGSRRT